MDDNKRLIKIYFDEAWNNRNSAVLDELLAPDYRRHLSPALPPLTAKEQKERMQELRNAFPDIRMEIQCIVAEQDFVCARIMATCTHQGVFHGKSPTGKRLQGYAVEIMRFDRGKIAEHWGGPDSGDFIRQIG